MPRSRSRSRSPRRSTNKSRSGGGGGFRWKEKPRHDDNEARDDRTLDRGYRDRDRDAQKAREEDRERRTETEDRHKALDEEEAKELKHRKARSERDGARPPATNPDPRDDDIAAKFGPSASNANSSKSVAAPRTAPQSKPPPPNPPARAVATGPMIVVKINDRLGTTSKVPCLPTDSIGDLKKLVAMRIGRKPHEIMLKRQSQRPFKDFLTLQDYEIGDGVQLDLELNTGD